ncbi:MAG: DNA repair protein RecO [Myxococcales bacterium]|nr:DNA repair protein RecO [Myxococcales bacterium]
MSAAHSSRAHSCRALLLGRVAYGESDLVVTLLTEPLGRVSALARGARRSSKRFAGALEPMHTLRVSLDERPRADLAVLREAALDRPRSKLVADLESLQAAGKALSWLRRATPPRTPEPEAWDAALRFLDLLDRDPGRQQERLVTFGMQLLEAFGWGLDLGRCVRCGKVCPPEQTALVNPERGGLVCRSCGGGPLRLESGLRHALLLAAQGHEDTIPGADLPRALELVERALSAHMGFD